MKNVISVAIFSQLQANGCYDSTQLDVGSTPIHPLYAVSLRSPDSVAGYSLASVNGEHSVNFPQ